MSEIIFLVEEDPEGGYSAHALGQSIFTEGETWDELRQNALEAVAAYFFDGVAPQRIRFRLVRDEVLSVA